MRKLSCFQIEPSCSFLFLSVVMILDTLSSPGLKPWSQLSFLFSLASDAQCSDRMGWFFLQNSSCFCSFPLSFYTAALFGHLVISPKSRSWVSKNEHVSNHNCKMWKETLQERNGKEHRQATWQESRGQAGASLTLIISSGHWFLHFPCRPQDFKRCSIRLQTATSCEISVFKAIHSTWR